MNQKICYVHELTDFEKQKANEIMNLSFNTDLLQDRLSYPHDTNLLISLVIVNDVIVGVALGKEKTENVGYVYVLSNKSLPPNTYKIGSTYGNPEERAEELTGTGHLHPFKVESNIKIQSAEYFERKIHSLLKNYRVKQNREFFEIDLNKLDEVEKEFQVEHSKLRVQIDSTIHEKMGDTKIFFFRVS